MRPPVPTSPSLLEQHPLLTSRWRHENWVVAVRQRWVAPTWFVCKHDCEERHRRRRWISAASCLYACSWIWRWASEEEKKDVVTPATYWEAPPWWTWDVNGDGKDDWLSFIPWGLQNEPSSSLKSILTVLKLNVWKHQNIFFTLFFFYCQGRVECVLWWHLTYRNYCLSGH